MSTRFARAKRQDMVTALQVALRKQDEKLLADPEQVLGANSASPSISDDTGIMSASDPVALATLVLSSAKRQMLVLQGPPMEQQLLGEDSVVRPSFEIPERDGGEHATHRQVHLAHSQPVVVRKSRWQLDRREYQAEARQTSGGYQERDR